MGRTAMEVSASTDVFDSPDLPTAALPSLARMDQVAANDVDHRMTDDDDHDGEAGLASHSNSSGSTVILDQEMSHSSPPSAPSPPTAEAVHPAPLSTSIDKRLPSPTKVANGLSSETVPAGPARSSKRIRATPSTSTRRSSTSLSTSPEISQGPLPKRRKGSTAGSTNGKSTKSAGAAAAPVKREVVEAGEDGLMDELEEELDEMDGEGEKKPKVLLTAVSFHSVVISTILCSCFRPSEGQAPDLLPAARSTGTKADEPHPERTEAPQCDPDRVRPIRSCPSTCLFAY